jgi:hypothetical protein
MKYNGISEDEKHGLFPGRQPNRGPWYVLDTEQFENGRPIKVLPSAMHMNKDKGWRKE